MTKGKVFIKDFSYNFLALVIMNLVIQFLVYPYLNKTLGEESFGVVLYLMSIVAILSNSFGGALNNIRLVCKAKFESQNGDYNSLLFVFCIISSAAALVILFVQNMLSVFNGILLCILIIITMIRYYSDAEYRLSLNYRRYFIYYVLLSGGYLGGLLLYHVTNNWYTVLIFGESIVVLFILLTGQIYKKPFQCSENRKKVWHMTIVLAASNLISNFFLNMDRIVLQNFLGGDAVTTFYTASLLGKTISLLIGPLSGVLISHLADYKGEFSRPLFTKAILLTSALTGVCFVGCAVISPWFLQIFYPNVYGAAKSLIIIGTAGQVLFFASALLMAVILRFCRTKYQFTIQLIYGIIYIALAIPSTISYGVWGFAYATLLSSIVRCIASIITGYREIKKSKVVIVKEEA